MDKVRNNFVSEITRLRSAAQKTTSTYLRRDYLKAVKRMEKELRQYDTFRSRET
jgi:hypothetical protein